MKAVCIERVHAEDLMLTIHRWRWPAAPEDARRMYHDSLVQWPDKALCDCIYAQMYDRDPNIKVIIVNGQGSRAEEPICPVARYE